MGRQFISEQIPVSDIQSAVDDLFKIIYVGGRSWKTQL